MASNAHRHDRDQGLRRRAGRRRRHGQGGQRDDRRPRARSATAWWPSSSRRRRRGQGGHRGRRRDGVQRRRAGVASTSSRARTPSSASTSKVVRRACVSDRPERPPARRRRSCGSTCRRGPAAAVRGLPRHADAGARLPAVRGPARARSSRSRPALAIERVIDLALRSVPAVEPGILFVERQFGVLEVHAHDLDDVGAAGRGHPGRASARRAADQLRPRVLYARRRSRTSPTSTRSSSTARGRPRWCMPGETLLVYEMTPALFAAVAANEAERAAPGEHAGGRPMIGAAGRVYIGGDHRGRRHGPRRDHAACSSAVEGREQLS